MQVYILAPVHTHTVDHARVIRGLQWRQEGLSVWWHVQGAMGLQVHDAASAMCRCVVLVPSGAIVPCHPCALRACRHKHMPVCTRCYRA